jgi:hypothetical protein
VKCGSKSVINEERECVCVSTSLPEPTIP